MKIPRLKPLQLLGLLCVVGFGSRLVVLLLKPKPDPFSVPGAMRMQDSREDAAARPFPAELVPPPDARSTSILAGRSQTKANWLEVGPQDARDDLYCSGIIYAFHRTQEDGFSAASQKRRDKIVALAERGTSRLLAAGAAQPGETAAAADAHSKQALADYAGGTARFTVEEAMAR